MPCSLAAGDVDAPVAVPIVAALVVTAAVTFAVPAYLNRGEFGSAAAAAAATYINPAFAVIPSIQCEGISKASNAVFCAESCETYWRIW